MLINEHTKVIARLHPSLDKKGLNIYNPYFVQSNTNAVYLLFQGPELNPLLRGLTNLNISGAIPAGFEKSPDLLSSMDSLDPIAKKVGKIGMIKQQNGKLIGHYQPGYGLANSIEEITSIKDKTICIMGASHVAHGLIEYLVSEKKTPREIRLYNRSVSNAEALANQYPNLVTKVAPLSELENEQGDIFINTTYVGSKSNKGNDYIFSDKLISAFNSIADVAFVPLHSQLIETAKRLNKPNSPGWKMFVHQGAYCLKTILDIDIDSSLLSQIAYKDFSENWK